MYLGQIQLHQNPATIGLPGSDVIEKYPTYFLHAL